MAAEDERLRHLRDKVDAQEQKLRKLRSLRGQADSAKSSNHSLCKWLHSYSLVLFVEYAQSVVYLRFCNFECL